MQRFVRQQIAKLLGRLAFEVHAGTKSLDPDRVHDLRVAARRIASALEIFEVFLPARAPRKIRKRLRRLMKGAAELRDRDIALRLLEEAGTPAEEPLLETLRSERREAEGHLHAQLKALESRGFSARWRERLELP